MLLCVAITLCVVAWGYLVFAAIDFGSTARGGDSRAWGFLALACLGAAACLFTGMILVGRLLRAAGIITDPGPPPTQASASNSSTVSNSEARPGREPPVEQTAPIAVVPTPRTQGGKRAAR